MSIREQFVIFAYCVFAGFVCGFIYDLCRAFKSELRLKRMGALVDLTFWSAVLCVFFATLFKSGSGQMRGFAIIGFVLGFIGYFFAISREASNILRTVIRFFIKIFGCFIYPLKRIYGVISKAMSEFVKIVQNIQKKAEKIVRKRLEKSR